MIHSKMIDANEGKTLVHALQNKDRMRKHAKRKKKVADAQIIVRTGPNSFELRDKTADELALEKKRKEEAEAARRQQQLDDENIESKTATAAKVDPLAGKGFGWTGAVTDTKSATGDGDPVVEDTLLFDAESRKKLTKGQEAMYKLKRKMLAAKREVKRLSKAMDTFTETQVEEAMKAKYDVAVKALPENKRDNAFEKQKIRQKIRKTVRDRLAAARNAASAQGLSTAQAHVYSLMVQQRGKQTELLQLEQDRKDLIKTNNIVVRKVNHARGVQARQRLQRDLIEVMRNRNFLPTIAAQPMENDIFEWHCNILGSGPYYEGLVLHVVLTFPRNYPHHSPKARLCTPIPHKNVFGSYICLDMLNNQWIPDSWEDHHSDQYTGWTRYVMYFSCLY